MLVTSDHSAIADSISGATIHIVRGSDSILRLQRVLADLSVRCGQPGVMDDVGYFLSKPGTLRRVPHLLLFSKAPVLDLEVTERAWEAALARRSPRTDRNHVSPPG